MCVVWRRCVCKWGMHFGHNGCSSVVDGGGMNGGHFVHQRFTVNDGIETVVVVGGVFDGTFVTIGIDQ